MKLVDVIDTFLGGDSKSIDINMEPIVVLEEVLKKKGYKKDYDDHNGWQVDFWIGFKHPQLPKLPKLCLSGSLYCGDFKLTKEE